MAEHARTAASAAHGAHTVRHLEATVERHEQVVADAAEENAALVSQVASLVSERQDFEQAFARMNQDTAKVSG